MLSADAIVNLHDRSTHAWHLSPNNPEPVHQGSGSEADWIYRVARQHRANFDLWHVEDDARIPGASDAFLAETKRRIDKINQQRNDLVEELDRYVLQWLVARSLPEPSAPLNSESPGLIVDRLSILALKIYHSREEANRAGAPAGHAERNLGRLAILEEQRTDLARCLDDLWRETLGGTRRFKIYHQLKMYNDPSLNPAIYGARSKEQG